jgi:hypothetical protein
VRLIYLDEAGISSLDHEPIMTVAGVIVHADGQFKAIERHLDELAERLVPDRSEDFSFHAYELFQGVGHFSDRDKWPLEKRLEILDELAAIPNKFNLPVCHCSMDRAEVRRQITEASTHSAELATHAHAFFYAAAQVELIMRAMSADEVAMLIAEDREQVRRILKVVHSIFRGRTPSRLQEFLGAMEAPWNKIVPFENVVESVQFAQKTESSLLQIADVCAFAIKRWVARKPHSERLFKPISEQFILADVPVGFGPLVRAAPWKQAPDKEPTLVPTSAEV